MKRISEHLLPLVLALSFAACGRESHADPARFSLRLHVEPQVRAGGDVRLRVTVEHSGTPCTSMYVDPVMSPFRHPSRPVMQLTLKLHDSAGRVQKPPAVPFAQTMMGARPEHLFLLECGMIIGWYVHLSRFGWDKLLPGEYSGTMSLTADTRTFVMKHPGYLEKLMEISGSRRDAVLERLGETRAETTFRIVVPGRPKAR